MVASPSEVFLRLVAGVAGRRWEDLPDLYAPEAVVTHPFATGSAARLTGRDQLREHFRRASARGLAMEVRDVTVHQTADPEVVVGEFAYCSRAGAPAAFRVPGVFVMRVRDGLIVESRDYIGARAPAD